MFFVETVLIEWGTEILFGLVSAGTLGWAKWYVNKIKKEKQIADDNAAIIASQKLDETIEIKLEPIYEELEELRNYIRKAKISEESHLALILSSYRFRLVQLCRGFLAQGYITLDQRAQLDEFYKVYTGLGGNGQAKVYYEQCIILPTKPQN